MIQRERRVYLIEYLKNEENNLKEIDIPTDEEAQKSLLRALMNIRPPRPISKEFITVQNAYLTEEQAKKGVVTLADLSPIQSGIYLWQGDITRLLVDAIVNAANRAMLGCFVPGHGCIDNAIPYSITQSCMQSRMAYG